MRRVSRLKMKLIPSPARFAAWGFFVRGPLLHTKLDPYPDRQRAHTHSTPIHPDAERERQGQVALYLLRMHIRYP